MIYGSKFLSFFLVCSFIFLIEKSCYSAGDYSCQESIKGLANIADVPTIQEMAKVSSQTVRMGGSFPGLSEKGGFSFLVHREGKTWASVYNEITYDLQGDPRWFISLLGEKHSEYLGFRILDDRTLIIPGPKEFLRRLEEISSKLSQEGKPAVKFYEQKKFILNQYIKAFVGKESNLPLAEGGNHYIHDISFHTGALFLPGENLDFYKGRHAFREDFFDDLRSLWGLAKTPKPQTALEATIAAKLSLKSESGERLRPTVDAYQYWLRFHETLEIDNGTGTLSVELLKASKDLNEGKIFEVSENVTRALRSFYPADLGVHQDLHQDALRVREMQSAVQARYSSLEQAEKGMFKPRLGETREQFAERLKTRIIDLLTDDPPHVKLGLDFPELMSRSKREIIIRDMLEAENLSVASKLEKQVIAYVDQKLAKLNKNDPNAFRFDLPMHRSILNGKNGHGFESEEEAVEFLCSKITQKRKALADAIEHEVKMPSYVVERDAWLARAAHIKNGEKTESDIKAAISNATKTYPNNAFIRQLASFQNGDAALASKVEMLLKKTNSGHTIEEVLHCLP